MISTASQNLLYSCSVCSFPMSAECERLKRFHGTPFEDIHLKMLCLSVCLSVGRSVCLSVCLSVRPSIHPSCYVNVPALCRAIHEKARQHKIISF